MSSEAHQTDSEDSSSYGSNRNLYSRDFKKVTLINQIDDSDSVGSEMESEVHHVHGAVRPAELSSQPISPTKPDRKSKYIKRNCESAKLSRNRKKKYICALEEEAKQLRNELAEHVSSLQRNETRMMNHLKAHSKEKYTYVDQKLKQSDTILKHISRCKNRPQPTETDCCLEPSTFEEHKRRRSKAAKPVGEFLLQKSQEKVKELFQELQLRLEAYLYKFSMGGTLRTNVIYSLMSQWLELFVMSANEGREQKTEIIEQFMKTIDDLQKNGQQIDFWLQKLREIFPLSVGATYILEKEYLKQVIPENSSQNVQE